MSDSKQKPQTFHHDLLSPEKGLSSVWSVWSRSSLGVSLVVFTFILELTQSQVYNLASSVSVSSIQACGTPLFAQKRILKTKCWVIQNPCHRLFQPEGQISDFVGQEAWPLSLKRNGRGIKDPPDVLSELQGSLGIILAFLRIWVCLRLFINTAWLNHCMTGILGTWSGYCSLGPLSAPASVTEKHFLGKFLLDLLLSSEIQNQIDLDMNGWLYLRWYGAGREDLDSCPSSAPVSSWTNYFFLRLSFGCRVKTRWPSVPP